MACQNEEIRPTFIPLFLLIDAVRKGHAPHAADRLRCVLHTFSIDNLQIQYGQEIPFEILKNWRLAGINPESANEVYECLARNGADPSQLIDSMEDPNLTVYHAKLGHHP